MSYDTLTHGSLTWTNIIAPTPEDIGQLHRAYPHFHPLDLEDCLSRIERPKIDEYDDYLFIVMQFPTWDHQRRISRPSEVDIFVGTGYFVTVHEGDLKPLLNLYAQAGKDEATRDTYMRSPGRMLHTVIDRLVDYLFPMLYKVDAHILSIEDTMFDADMQRAIQDLSFVRRDIIALRRIIRPQVSIVYNLEQVDRPYIHDALEVYFGDILDHLQKARDILDDDSEVIVSLADTTDALASQRINEVMRILTVISVIFLPLTLISGIFGMNVPLPLPADSSLSFWAIVAAMLIVSGIMLTYFRHRNWL